MEGQMQNAAAEHGPVHHEICKYYQSTSQAHAEVPDRLVVLWAHICHDGRLLIDQLGAECQEVGSTQGTQSVAGQRGRAQYAAAAADALPQAWQGLPRQRKGEGLRAAVGGGCKAGAGVVHQAVRLALTILIHMPGPFGKQHDRLSLEHEQ